MADTSSSFSCDLCKITLTGHQQLIQHKSGKKHLNKTKKAGVTEADDGATTADPNQEKVYGSFVAASPSEAEGHLNGNQEAHEGTGTGQFSQPQTAVPFNQGFNSDTLAQISSQGGGDSTNESNGTDTGTGPDPVGEAVRQNLLGNLPKKRKAVMVGRCDTCGIEFNSEDQQSAHMGGKKHAKRMKQAGGETRINPANFYCSYCELQLNSIEQFNQHLAGNRHARKVESIEGPAKENTDQETDNDYTDDVVAPPPPPPSSGVPLPPAQLEAMKHKK